jgi:hypothetical protein
LHRTLSSGSESWEVHDPHAVSISSLQITCEVLVSSTVAVSAPYVASASASKEAEICAAVPVATSISAPRLPP